MYPSIRYIRQSISHPLICKLSNNSFNYYFYQNLLFILYIESSIVNQNSDFNLDTAFQNHKHFQIRRTHLMMNFNSCLSIYLLATGNIFTNEFLIHCAAIYFFTWNTAITHILIVHINDSTQNKNPLRCKESIIF